MTCSKVRSRWSWFLAAGCLLVLILGLLLPHPTGDPAKVTPGVAPARQANGPAPGGKGLRRTGAPPPSAPMSTAEEIVARKVIRFSVQRRALALAMAKRLKIEMSGDLEKFFDAAEAGRWDELKERFQSLAKARQDAGSPADLQSLWGPVLETFGVAEAAHDWPPQRLLDYGQAVLDSLRPGMVYVGGTDPGRFIPTLMNETSDGEHHILLTQNALADASYLQYVDFQYADQMATLSEADCKSAFDAYVTDAQQRLLHDQQFPDEPKQIRPGESVGYVDASGQTVWNATDGPFQVSGQVAVMAINERLLQMILDRNPASSFALEESFPLKSTYPDAAPLGPIMELGVQGPQSGVTPESAAAAVDYWRSMAAELQTDPATADASDPLRAYSKMAVAQANLLADHNYPDAAAQAYAAAIDICPYNPEAVFQYVNLLLGQKRPEDAPWSLNPRSTRTPGTASSVTSWRISGPPRSGARFAMVL